MRGSVQGYVLDYSVQAGVGVITADDGNRYEFAGTEWRDGSFPLRGSRVDFDVRDGVAVAVYNNPLPVGASTEPFEIPPPAFTPFMAQVQYHPPSGKNRTAAAILAILLGGIGVHKFYLGSWGWGLVYFVFSWTFIPAAIGIIEGIRYLVLSDEAFEFKALAGRSAFGSIW